MQREKRDRHEEDGAEQKDRGGRGANTYPMKKETVRAFKIKGVHKK